MPPISEILSGDRLADYDYDLPDRLIATQPARPREAARLLHVGAAFDDLFIRDLPGLLRPGDVLVVNDTKVIPAQLSAMRGEARIGITLDRLLPDGRWRVLLRNAKRVRDGDFLAIGDDGFGATAADVRDGVATLGFNLVDEAFYAALARHGALALPPYIARPDGVTARDATDYQTMFAAHEGAVAAPTAGLHFSSALLDACTARGAQAVRVTLHVGAGTFLPVRVENLAEHRMHAERGVLTAEAAATINGARGAGNRIVPVGTTALRLLESAANADGVLHPFDGETDIFIRPGYRFKIADRLITNFHLPRSTLLMLVSAFAGLDRIRAAYAHAISSEYRFYSYGDACLLEKA